MAIHLTATELEAIKEIDFNASKHVAVVNDIYSYEKEVLAVKKGYKECGALCSSVQIMANQADLSVDSAKRILWAMCREWELHHRKLVASIEESVPDPSPALLEYLRGLEYEVSGHELWCHTTDRYRVAAAT